MVYGVTMATVRIIGVNMKKILVGLFLANFAFAALSQVEYNTTYTQYRKYMAASYFWGADTTTAKSDPGVWVSSNGSIGIGDITLYNYAGEQWCSFAELMTFYSITEGKNILTLGDASYLWVNLDVEPLKKIDGRDISVDGATLDSLSISTGAYLTENSSPTLTGKWDYKNTVWISSSIEGTENLKLQGNRYIEMWTKTGAGIKTLVSKFFDDIVEFYVDVDIDGTLNMLDNRITHISTTPISASDATSKEYVDYLKSLSMQYAEYDQDKDGYVNKADTATYALNSGTASYVSGNVDYAINAGTAVFAQNSDNLDGFDSTNFLQNPATADEDMNGYRVINSSTIAYSTYSATLVTAKYVKDNVADLCKIVIGTTTVQTTSTSFVELGLRSSVFINREGTSLAESSLKISCSIKDVSVDFVLVCSTNPAFTVEETVGTSTFFVPKADAEATIIMSSFKRLDTADINKIYYFRVMWRTEGGTITNSNAYISIPNRKIITKFYPNFEDIEYEE